MELIIITGMSGAGKSKAVGALEDAGYYCVDNIPPRIMLMIAGLRPDTNRADMQRTAIVVDARTREMWGDPTRSLEELRRGSMPYRMIFLDASNQVLVSRYKETRRRHPLWNDRNPGLLAAIKAERELLRPLREMADTIIDTSHTIPAQLRERVLGAVAEGVAQRMSITCMSFGFRNGLPPEADLVFDVRCLPNPFYVPELRSRTGNEKSVRDYVMSFPQTQEFFDHMTNLLAFSAPMYVREGKTQLLIAVGCTGGRHRSVVTAEYLGGFMREQGYSVTVAHRDMSKDL